MGSQFTGASAMAGKSKMSGRSSLSAQGEDILASMLKYHAYVINAAILEMNQRLQQIGRQEIVAWKEFSLIKEEIKQAQGMAEKGAAAEAVSRIQNAYQDFCYNPDTAEADKEMIGKILTGLNPKWLEQENDMRSKDLISLCDKTIRICEKKDLDSEAWKSLKESIADARAIAGHKKLMQMAMVRCRAEDADVASDILREAGVASRVFYSVDDSNTGYVVVPEYSRETKNLIHAAIAEACIRHERANIISESSMEMIMKLRGAEDGQVISGLTLQEAEAVQESMYGRKIPVVVKAPETADGTFSVIYSKRDEKYVGSIILQEMIRERGAGYDAHIGQMLQTNYMARQGVDTLISKISLGNDTFGYVVDADQPEHHLLITKDGITETFPNGKQDFVRFDKIPNPSRYEVEIKERVMQLAPRIAFLPAKEAKACGIDRSQFEVTDQLKERLSEIMNPQNKMIIENKESPEETKKYQNEVRMSLAGQTSFAKFAAKKAMDAFEKKDLDFKAMTQYVAENIPALISQYKHEQEQRIQRTVEKDKQEQALKTLGKTVKSLRGQSELNTSMEDIMKDISENVLADNAKVKIEEYQPKGLDSMDLDDISISERQIRAFQDEEKENKSITKENKHQQDQAVNDHEAEITTNNNQNENHPGKEDNDKKNNVKYTKDRPLTKSEILQKEKVAVKEINEKKNKIMESGKMPERKAEAIAVASIFQKNLQKALMNRGNIPPADPYLKAYGIVPEEEVIKIDRDFQNVSNISLEAYDRLDKTERAEYENRLRTIIKADVQRAVGRGMKTRAANLGNIQEDNMEQKTAVEIINDEH